MDNETKVTENNNRSDLMPLLGNRTIKFRAWDTERKEMLLPGRLCHLEGYATEALKESAPYLILMQFTGLKDKNGKEIYEGDILETSKTFHLLKKFVVVFKDGSFVPDNFVVLALNKNPFSEYEVIGNIFENPELLKEVA